MWWLFTDEAEAEKAQAEAFSKLPADTLHDGSIAPVQVTKRWANIQPMKDGASWTIPVKVGMAAPSKAAVKADIKDLLPVQDDKLPKLLETKNIQEAKPLAEAIATENL